MTVIDHQSVSSNMKKDLQRIDDVIDNGITSEHTPPQRKSHLYQVIHDTGQELINRMSFKLNSRNRPNLIHLV